MTWSFCCKVPPVSWRDAPAASRHTCREHAHFFTCPHLPAGKARQPAAHGEDEGVVGTFDWIVDFTHLEKYLTCDSLGVQRDARSAFVPKP